MKLVRFLSLSLNLASLGALAADPGTLPPPASRPSGLPIAEPRRAEPVDFEREILPILKENCLACHNQTKAKAGLILETPQTILKGGDSGPALVPGRGAESLLLKAAAHQLEDTIMPPVGNKSNARNLTPEELGLLKLWIDQGARGEVRGLGAVEWQPLPDQFNPIYAVALTSDGRFAACNRGNRLFVYHLPAGRLEARLADPQFAVGASNVLAGAAHRDLVQSLAFSPEGTVLASGSYREVKLWRRRPGGKRWEHPASNALSLAVSPDGQWIALGTDAGTVRLLDGEGHTVGTWPAHETSVHSLAFGPDATQLLTGARDGSARIWSVPGGAAAGRFEVPGGVEAVAWLGSRRIAAAATNKVIYLHELPAAGTTSAPAPRELKGHPDAITSLASRPEDATRLLSGDAAGFVRWWDAEKGTLIHEFKHEGPVTAVAVRGDGRRLASAGLNQAVRLWNPEDGKMVAEMKGNFQADQRVAARTRTLVVLSNDIAYRRGVIESTGKEHAAQRERVAKAVATNEFTGKVFAEKKKALADAATAHTNALTELGRLHEEIKRVTEAFQNAEQAARDAAARAKAAASRATEAKLLADQAAQTRNDAERIAEDTAAVASKAKGAARKDSPSADAGSTPETMVAEAVAIATRARAFAESAATNAVQKLKAAAEAKIEAERAIEEVATRAFAAGQARVPLDRVNTEAPEKLKNATNTVTAAQKTLTEAEKEFQRAQTRHSITSHELELAQAAAARGSNAVLAAQSAFTAAEQALKEGEAALAAARENAARFVRPWRALAFSPDHRTLLAAGDAATVHAWNADSGAALETWSWHSNAVLAVAFSGAGTVSLGADQRLVRWNTAPDWTLERSLGDSTDANSPLVDRVMAVRFSPDGRHLATGGGEPSRSGEINLWAVDGGRLVKEFGQVHSDTVLALDFSPDGRFLASGAADRFARVTDVESGKVIKAFEGHTHHVTSVSWKQDGRTLATGGADNVVKIWDFVSGERRKNIDTFGKEVTALQFIGITDQVAVASGDRLVRIINDNGEKIRDLAGARDFMNAVAGTPDGRLIVAGGQDSVLRVWNGTDGRELATYPPSGP